MDIQKERQEFELLPDIRGIIQDGFQFNSELNQYFHLDHVNHRLSYAFLMGAWLAAKAQAVPEANALLGATLDAVQKLGSGDFVLVPKEPIQSFKEKLENYLFDLWAGDHGCDWDGFLSADAVEHDVLWKMMLEAQEQSHDGK